MKSIEKLKNIQTVLKEDETNTKMECLIEAKSKVTIALDF